MKHQAEFVKDASGKKLNVTREFNAPVEKVWKAWTTADILDKWWAPKPYVNKTKSMDFKEGGSWLYSMTSPQGESHWCRVDYKTITPQQNYNADSTFCDEDGNINKALPNMNWFNEFKSTPTGAKVQVTLTFDNEEALEAIVKMGFKEGLSMGLDNLDEVLAL